ncbi:MAG TPA: dTDP-4-dehydrorhamnose reductase [Candidatus Limnocylindrales bacterium]|nr:dTDP-4-dehydrorhamnose reductase [Candidatus Limnocylindrales bacterium]
MTAPILLISPDGMLGHAFELLLARRGLEYTGVSWPAFDLTKPETVEPWMQPGVRTIINCSAYTDVDGAETHQKEADAINGAGVALLASHARRLGAVLVHFSTDYVFDGHATSPYEVDHPIAPINAYGRSKAVGEAAIRESGCEHLIIRTSWLYAPWAKNFVLTMLALGREKTSLNVVSDQVGRPTSAQYLAERSLALVERGARGTFHVTDGGSCSWFELASMVMAASGSSCRVNACTSAEFVRPAVRPPYSILDLSRTEALLGPSTDWKTNVRAVLEEHARTGAAEPERRA